MYVCMYLFIYLFSIYWLRYTDRTPVCGRSTFPVLHPICSWLVATNAGKQTVIYSSSKQPNSAFHPFRGRQISSKLQLHGTYLCCVWRVRVWRHLVNAYETKADRHRVFLHVKTVWSLPERFLYIQIISLNVSHQVQYFCKRYFVITPWRLLLYFVYFHISIFLKKFICNFFILFVVAWWRHAWIQNIS